MGSCFFEENELRLKLKVYKNLNTAEWRLRTVLSLLVGKQKHNQQKPTCVAGVDKGRGQGGRRVIDPTGYFIGHFSGIFSRSLLFHFCISSEDSRIILLLLNPKTVCEIFPVYLFQFQHRRERAQSISLWMKRISSIYGIYRVSQKFVPLLYKSVFLYD